MGGHVLIVLMSLAWGTPMRNAEIFPTLLMAPIGRDNQKLIVKLSEDQGLSWSNGLLGSSNTDLSRLLAGARPLFARPVESLKQESQKWDPKGDLADLSLYLQVYTNTASALHTQLKAFKEIERSYLASKPVAPPVDLPPTTPVFEQAYRSSFPLGLSIDEQYNWPSAQGAGILIADIEYGWLPSHEDLENAPTEVVWGWNSNDYQYHGNGVLGILIATPNDYGITGISPASEVVMLSPFASEGEYNVAAAISGATGLLSAGDILLIEQQGYVNEVFCPVEVEPAVFDAITLAVAKGIIVVEPAGNGAQNLDASIWGGWFQRSLQDSGAIIVAGGASPLSGHTPRMWYPSGSSYGSRIDVQAWYDNTVTLGGAGLSDLFYPGNDENQAYTSSFGGSSGASAMIAGISAVLNGVAMDKWGAPYSPEDLRDSLRLSGFGPENNTPFNVGPQPDLKQFLWMLSLR